MRQLITFVRNAAVALAMAAVAALAAVTLGPALAGYDRYVITSGSMSGTYDTGSIVYTKAVPTESLRVGDVITYAPPAGASPTALVTHRIASIAHEPGGERVFATKGDANASADGWRFELPDARQGRVAFGLPLAGYVFVALGRRELRMLLIGVPALLVALSVLLGMIREARAESRGEVAAGKVATTVAGQFLL